jgi:queuine tRNA-ribosyltransferase
MLGPILLSIHNLAFYSGMLADARRAIIEGRLGRFRNAFSSAYLRGREEE